MISFVIVETKDQEIFISFEVGAILACLNEAIDLIRAETDYTTVSFNFSHRRLHVNADSNLDLLLRNFWRHCGPEGVDIGPYPDPLETEEDRLIIRQDAESKNSRLRLVR
jgi:hypothetical protein